MSRPRIEIGRCRPCFVEAEQLVPADDLAAADAVCVGEHDVESLDLGVSVEKLLCFVGCGTGGRRHDGTRFSGCFSHAASSPATSAKAVIRRLTCRCGGGRRDQHHVVEGCDQHAAIDQRHMDCRFERRRMRGFGLAAVLQRARCADELDARADAHDMPRQSKSIDDRGQPGVEPARQPLHVGVVRVCHHLFERRAHRGELQRIGRQRRAHAGIARLLFRIVGAVALGEFCAHAPDACRHAASDRLAEHEKIGLEVETLRVTARAGRDGVRFVDQQQRACLASKSAERVMEARLGQHHAAIGEHRLGDDAGDVLARRGPFPALECR